MWSAGLHPLQGTPRPLYLLSCQDPSEVTSAPGLAKMTHKAAVFTFQCG